MTEHGNWPLGPRADVAPFLAMDVLSKANALEAAGSDIVHMELGQPGAALPDVVTAESIRVLSAGQVPYSEAVGIPPLREAIARHYQETAGLAIDPARIVVTAGSSAAFQLVFLCLFAPGARIGLTRPYYPAYPNIVRALGLEPVFIDTDAEAGYSLDREKLREAMPDLDGLLVASPNNPTGTLLSREDLAACAEGAAAHGTIFICDEIYHGISYGDDPCPTALSVTDDVIVVNSFSKYFCMPGWRIGWAVVPPGLTRPLERLTQNLFVAPTTPGQQTAVAALSPEARPAFDRVVADYRVCREALLSTLPGLGFSRMSRVDGAFYVYADISAFGMSSTDFCDRLLREAGVAITPGLDFDDRGGASCVRFSFAGGSGRVLEGLDRLSRWCQTLTKGAPVR